MKIVMLLPNHSSIYEIQSSIDKISNPRHRLQSLNDLTFAYILNIMSFIMFNPSHFKRLKKSQAPSFGINPGALQVMNGSRKCGIYSTEYYSAVRNNDMWFEGK
jgi:hypothetical protein